MGNIVFISETYKQNKPKAIMPDKDGYYDVIGGALGIKNRDGEYYIASQYVRDLFSKSSTFMKRVNERKIYAEVNHPERTSNQSDEDFAKRWLFVDIRNAAAFIKSVRISEEPITIPGQADSVYPIWLKVKPFGKYGDILKQSLEDPDINTAFSIRCLSKPLTIGGKRYRRIFYVITFDFVDIQGISIADKDYTNQLGVYKPTGESISFEVDEETIREMANSIQNDSTLTKENKDELLNIIGAIDKCSDESCVFNGW